jgi:hypothetical protein
MPAKAGIQRAKRLWIPGSPGMIARVWSPHPADFVGHLLPQGEKGWRKTLIRLASPPTFSHREKGATSAGSDHPGDCRPRATPRREFAAFNIL